jgi:hypothetical protein
LAARVDLPTPPFRLETQRTIGTGSHIAQSTKKYKHLFLSALMGRWPACPPNSRVHPRPARPPRVGGSRARQTTPPPSQSPGLGPFARPAPRLLERCPECLELADAHRLEPGAPKNAGSASSGHDCLIRFCQQSATTPSRYPGRALQVEATGCSMVRSCRLVATCASYYAPVLVTRGLASLPTPSSSGSTST